MEKTYFTLTVTNFNIGEKQRSFYKISNISDEHKVSEKLKKAQIFKFIDEYKYCPKKAKVSY